MHRFFIKKLILFEFGLIFKSCFKVSQSQTDPDSAQ